MNRKARDALATVRRCVREGRVLTLRHFVDQLERRGLFWADVLALLERPRGVRADGHDDRGRSGWIIVGRAADAVTVGPVCVLGRDASGEITVFITMFWEDRSMAARNQTHRPPSAELPYTIRLPDGRTVFVVIPAGWTETDASGEIAFRPRALRLLDGIRALAAEIPTAPTPGLVAALRRALGLTQAELGAKLGVDKMTVSRWERGAVRPSLPAARALERLRRESARKGVVVAA